MDITLKSGGNTAVVCTTGGELISFRDGAGTEFIWTGDPAYWSGHNPILFPIVGNLKDGRVEIKGRTCEMGRHGFARRSEFTAAEQGEDFVVLELRENEQTLAQYPYPFLLRVTHKVTEDGFSTAFQVDNTGDGPMPFCIGAHTGINCPLRPGERFEDYELVFDGPEQAASLLLTGDGLIAPGQETLLDHSSVLPLSYGLFERLPTVIFDGLRSHGVCLRHKATGRGVHMDFPGWPMIAFWTPGQDAPFICLEPWHGCAALEGESGKLEDKPHCVTLEPGESAGFAYTVTVV